MKTQLQSIVASTAVAVLSGCASGGGGSGDAKDAFICLIAGPACALLHAQPPSSNPAGASSSSSTPTPATPTQPYGPPPPVTSVDQFSTWSSASRFENRDTLYRFDSSRTELQYYQGSSASISNTYVRGSSDGELLARLWENGRFIGLPRGDGLTFSTADATFVNLASIGQPGLDVVAKPGDGNPFTSMRASDLVLMAKPFAHGWDYQSFGVWNYTNPNYQTISPISFGSATPASAVPTIGAASFSGKLGGLYVSPAGEGSIATANVKVDADFSTRSLSLASSGTTITRDLQTATAAPNLNLSGTLTYSPASNTFTGTLTNAGGTMSGSSTGRYYGPAAQELGGVFTVKSATSVETFAGAYGGKR